MAEIISFNKAVNEQRDRENGVFSIREEDGDLKDITEWTGEDWRALIEGVFTPMSEIAGCSAYDLLADFIGMILESQTGETGSPEK